MKLHLGILDEKRRELLRSFSSFSRTGYLAGGTALALQIGHRQSYDFDIFLYKKISNALLQKVRKIFSIRSVLINTSDELTFFTKDGVKITFLYYPFPLKEYCNLSRTSIPLLSPHGVALAKAYALNRRNAWRDYVDLYWLMKLNLTTVSLIIKDAKCVYGEMFSEKFFLAQLTYTDDITQSEIDATPMMAGYTISLTKVKRFFLAATKKYMKGLTYEGKKIE